MSRLAGATAALVALLGLPAVVLAHGLVGRYESPLPLVVYLSGAGIAVALSFTLVLVRDIRAGPSTAGRVIVMPRAVRLALRAVGLLAWVWIVVQALLGGGGPADVASLFLWVYGWVGLALISALLFPIWQWLDPFATLHDLGAAVLRRLGVGAWNPAHYPSGLGQLPALIGFVFFVWIELVAYFGIGGRTAGIVMLGYTVLALVGMAQYGRETWRANGETFSVWFGTLGRLAPFGLSKQRSDVVVRRPFASGLLDPDWSPARLALVALGTGSILYDGLSQTQRFFDVFGVPYLIQGTGLLAAFLGGLCLVVFAVARVAGRLAVGAGLVPIAVGYLVAHYLTFLLGDGQRIVVAISDPLQQGWDIFGTAFYEPGTDWIPPGLLWTVVLCAVVGGHMIGAWAGHVATARNARADLRRRQVPLAILMVTLTVTTLWSLGQTVVRDNTETPSALVRGTPTASTPTAAVQSSKPTAVAPSGITFVSVRYGYSLVHPEGWTVVETPGTGGVHPGEAGVDTFKDLLGHSLSIVGEPAVPALSEWTCAIGQHLQGEHELAVEQVEDLNVAELPARLSSYHLLIKPYVIHYFTVEIVRGQQGITLSLESTTGDDAADRVLLDSLLGAFSFTG